MPRQLAGASFVVLPWADRRGPRSVRRVGLRSTLLVPSPCTDWPSARTWPRGEVLRLREQSRLVSTFSVHVLRGLGGCPRSPPSRWVSTFSTGAEISGDRTRSSGDESLSDPNQYTSRGNEVDTRIAGDYNDYAADKRACGEQPEDRCSWLRRNADNYPRRAVNSTMKAWGCKRNRVGRDRTTRRERTPR